MTDTARSQPRARYSIVFIILAVFTALEIGTSYLPAEIKVPVLLLLAFMKASLILLYFMHIKFDNRAYFWTFLFGVVVVIPLILIFLLAMPALQLV